MTIKNRLVKLESQRPLLASTEQTEQSKLDILWGVDTRYKAEVRANIESLIEEYQAMPVIA